MLLICQNVQKHQNTFSKISKSSKNSKIANLGGSFGDVIVEHDFSDSEDEEVVEIQEAEAERQRLEAAAAAKGKRRAIVVGIPWSADDDAVKRYFRRCGSVVEMSCPKKDDGRPNGLAFITFDSEAAVVKALLKDGNTWEWPTVAPRNESPKGSQKE